MKTSDKGIVAIMGHEGIVPAPYLDSVNVWTYGVGHAESSGLPPKPSQMPRGNPADLDAAIKQAIDVFCADLPVYERAVNRALKVPVAQHEFDALVSFHYNTGGIARANLTKNLNNGDRRGAANGFMGWLRPPEIEGRRKAEQSLFRTGEYPTGKIPVYSVTASNRPGAMIRRLSPDEALAMMGAQSSSPAPRPRPAPPAPAKEGLLARIIAAIVAMFKRNPR